MAVRNVVGLHLHSPEHTLVLCVDEKSQIQALDRMQPGKPTPFAWTRTAGQILDKVQSLYTNRG